MCRVLGDLLQAGIVAKIADDLYCGAQTGCSEIGLLFSKFSIKLACGFRRRRPSSTLKLLPSWVGLGPKALFAPALIASQRCPPAVLPKKLAA